MPWFYPQTYEDLENRVLTNAGAGAGGQWGRAAAHLLEGQRGLIPVLACEIVVHAKVGLAAQLVPRGTVRDALDHPALGRKGRGSGCGHTIGRGTGAAPKQLLGKLTPGAVATTRYGKTKRSRPTSWKMFLKRSMICRASMSWEPGETQGRSGLLAPGACGPAQ